MRLEWRLFCWFVALLSAAVVVATGAAYVTQTRLQNRDDAFLSALLSQAWQQASRRAEAEFHTVQNDGLWPAVATAVCAPDVHPALDRWSSAHPGWRIELADASGNLLYTNATTVDAPSLVGGIGRMFVINKTGGAASEVSHRARSASYVASAVGVPSASTVAEEHAPFYFDVLGPGAYAWVSVLQLGTSVVPSNPPSAQSPATTAMTATTSATTATISATSATSATSAARTWQGACRASSASVLLIGRDVGPALTAASRGLGGRLVMRPLALPALQTPPVLRTPQGAFEQISLTVKGADARPLANLVWQPGAELQIPGDAGNGVNRIDHTGEAGTGPRSWINRMAMCLAAAVSLGLAFLWLRWGVRHFFAPLERSMQAFNTLLGGDYVLNLDDEDSERRDQAGQMARGVSQMRTDLLNLRMLQEERERSAQQQGRLIREPLLNLARGLDDSDRDDIATWLDRLDWQGQESRSPLADLAGVLDRLTTLVSAQHQKRLLALRELALASQRDAQFAALQQELDIARQMQLSILPTNLPGWHGLNLAATIIPAKEVGGDFYDYFLLDARHLALVIADVSGKGVPAAFFMAIARSLLKSMADVSIDPAQTITRLNDLLCEDNPQWMFVTLFYGVLDLHTGVLQYVNAGHNPPLIASARASSSRSSPLSSSLSTSALSTSLLPAPLQSNSHIRKLAAARNPALGVVEEHVYCGDTAQLSDGDLLFLYTDGFSEAQNQAQALFGDAALVDALSAVCCDVFMPTASTTASNTASTTASITASNTASTIASSTAFSTAFSTASITARDQSDTSLIPDVAAINDGMIAVVRAFEEGAAQADDMTCLSLRYTSPRLVASNVTPYPLMPDHVAQAR